jgi:poly-beta-1,6-N-acetyl-D-glucosamine synthase
MFENILIIVSIILPLHYLFFLYKIYFGLDSLSRSGRNIPEEYISVIVPFRNESANILTVLNSLENQSYPKEKFEIIFVNDDSSDNGLELLLNTKVPENVKVLSVPKDYQTYQFKKRAIQYGIKNSRGELIVTTDADCIHDREWLSVLAGSFEPETGFVSAPVEFESNGSFFSDFQKIEFAGLIISGAGLIGAGRPLICNGANIAYRRIAFELVNGFEHPVNLTSGDDEILMQKIFRSKKFKIKFIADRGAVVKTDPSETIEKFFMQRQRWASKSLFYSDKKLIIKLFLIFLFYTSLPVLLSAGILFSPKFLFLFAVLIISKIIAEFLLLKKGAKIIFGGINLKQFLVFELVQIPYIIIASIAGTFGNFKWKERKIKR